MYHVSHLNLIITSSKWNIQTCYGPKSFVFNLFIHKHTNENSIKNDNYINKTVLIEMPYITHALYRFGPRIFYGRNFGRTLKMKKVQNNTKNENQLQVFLFTLVSDSQKLQPIYRQKTLKKVKFSISKLIRTNLFMDFVKINFF